MTLLIATLLITTLLITTLHITTLLITLIKVTLLIMTLLITMDNFHKDFIYKQTQLCFLSNYLTYKFFYLLL
jgi:hypothetical protein